MIQITVRERDAAAQATGPITSGSVGLRVSFCFSDDWEGLTKAVIFKGSGTAVDVALASADSCTVPHEVLQSAGGHLKIGVYGTGSQGQRVTPTIWADAGQIVEGAEPSEVDPTPATQSLVQQILEAAEDAAELAQSLRDDADNGEFDGEDGVSPGVSVSTISGGHRLTITDKDHPNGQTVDVMDGVGVPSGGTTGQILKKKSGTDYDTEWADAAYDPEAMTVTITESNGAYSADKTYDEIRAANTAGKRVVAKHGQAVYQPGVAKFQNTVWFYSIRSSTLTVLTINKNNVVSLTSRELSVRYFDFSVDGSNDFAVTPGTGVTAAAIKQAKNKGETCCARITFTDNAHEKWVEILSLTGFYESHAATPVVLISGTDLEFSGRSEYGGHVLLRCIRNNNVEGWVYERSSGTKYFDFAVDDSNGFAVTPGTGVTVAGIQQAASDGKTCFARISFENAAGTQILPLTFVSEDENNTDDWLEFAGGFYDGSSNSPAVLRYLDTSGWAYQIKDYVARNQGAANAGKLLMVGPDGTVANAAADSLLSSSSEKPVQNKVIKAALDGKGTYSKPSGGIPETDLASDVQAKLDSAYNAFPHDTASGATASFHDGADNVPVKDLTIAIEPVQSGSGDPAPDNVRPISGWTGANIFVSPSYDAQDGATYTISFPTEAGTVYGGTLDVTTGTLTVTHASDALTGSENIAESSTNGFMMIGDAFNEFMYKYAIPSTQPYPIPICSHYKGVAYQVSSGLPVGVCDCFTGTQGHTIGFKTSFDTPQEFAEYLAAQNANGTPVRFVLPLRTPRTYQLTPQEVATLLGTNSIWADTGDSTVDYRADPTLYIQKLTGSTEEDLIANKAIASGKYFLVGNRLFLSTTAIAAGAMLTPGTNCTETNLAAALNAINS